MKLLFVVQRYGEAVVGGAERYVRDQARALVAAGHQVDVVTSCATSYEDWADDYAPGPETESGVAVHRLSVVEPRPNGRFLPLHVRAVDRGQPQLWPWSQQRWASLMGPELRNGASTVAGLARRSDVVVMVGYHYAHTLTLTRAAAAFAPTVVAPTAHPEGAFFVGVVRRMFEYCDLALCLSQAEASIVRDIGGPHQEVSVVGCPVVAPGAPSQAEIQTSLSAYGVGDGPYLVVVGRVDPAKGSDEIVEYVRALRRSSMPTLRLVIVGPGSEPGEHDGVITTGFVSEEDKLALIAGSVALVQPSYMESFSISLMEGWLLGRPAIVQGANRVLAEHLWRSGGGLAYGDLPSFELAVATLLSSAELRDHCAKAGRDYCLSEFDTDAVNRRFLTAMELAIDIGGTRLQIHSEVV